MLIKRKLFSDNNDPKPKRKYKGGNGIPEIALGSASLPLIPGFSDEMESKLRNKEVMKVKDEVSKRITELGERSARGDKKAAKAVFTLAHDPAAMEKLVGKTFDNPRVRKAAIKGKIIGAMIPLVASSALVARGVYKSNKFDKSEKQYKKDLKAWRERNKDKK